MKRGGTTFLLSLFIPYTHTHKSATAEKPNFRVSSVSLQMLRISRYTYKVKISFRPTTTQGCSGWRDRDQANSFLLLIISPGLLWRVSERGTHTHTTTKRMIKIKLSDEGSIVERAERERATSSISRSSLSLRK